MRLKATRWEDAESDTWIDRINTPDGPLFAVRNSVSECLGVFGDWIDEPIPSQRTPQFYRDYRFIFWDQAVTALKKWLETNRSSWEETKHWEDIK